MDRLRAQVLVLQQEKRILAKNRDQPKISLVKGTSCRRENTEEIHCVNQERLNSPSQRHRERILSPVSRHRSQIESPFVKE